jgi:PAS domain S-box-containing protein
LLRDSSDVQLLGQAPPWETLHAGRVLAIGGGLGFAGLAWIWLLRRRVQHRTAELTCTNDLLRTSEARYRTLVENAPEAIVVLDTETGRFIEANENAVRLFGLSRAALLEAGPAQLSPPVQPDGQSSAAGAQARIQAALKGNGAPFEWVHRRAGGVDFPSEVRVARLPVPGRQLVIGAITDITERKRAEAEMKNALAKEKQLSELKSSFVSMVSHEFRTPLGVIMSSAEILESYNDRLKPERRSEVLQDIFQSTRRMADLMEEVLLLGRVEAGKVQCKPVPLELASFCQRLTDELLAATQRRCPILFSEQGKLARALADEALVRLIVTNLLSNAAKYSPEGTAVDFSVAQDGADAVFVVRDRGIGIPEADTGELFLAFHRGGNVGDIPGTGLGMVIVKRCVDLHRGTISVESATGVGTTITVRLPLFQSERV